MARDQSARQLGARAQIRGAGNAFSALRASLEGGQSAAIIVEGDSTGNETSEWVYLLGQQMAALIPSARVSYKLWNDTSQDYDAPTVLQAAAGERGVLFSSVTSNRGRALPTGDVGYPTTDIDVRVKASATDWTPAASAALAALYGVAGSRAWRLYINTSGKVIFEWSNDGTTLLSFGSGASTPALTDGLTYWIRATLDVDNGGGGYTVTTYYSADDQATWTQIGTSATAAGITSLFQAAGSSGYNLGARTLNGDIWNGTIYACEIRDGIGGKILNPQGIEAWNRTDTAADLSTLVGSPTLYIVNGSKSGADLAYLTDSTRMPKIVQPYQNALVFLSTSHNDFTDSGKTLTDKWDSWLTALKARLPVAAFVPVIQNPEVLPATRVEEQGKRTAQLAFWATKNGLPFIDVRRAFNQAGAAALTNSGDGIHPTAAGEALWRDVVSQPFNQRDLRPASS